jgi:hypothetical protein
VSPLGRRCDWLLRAYPAWYRRKRAGEMLGTLLEASPPGQGWPAFRDARALIIGGLRVRGWVWLLSMLWVVAGVAETGYVFYITTKPFTRPAVAVLRPGWVLKTLLMDCVAVPEAVTGHSINTHTTLPLSPVASQPHFALIASTISSPRPRSSLGPAPPVGSGG